MPALRAQTLLRGNHDLGERLRAAQRELADFAGTQLRLLEAEETLRAIRLGEVDALVVNSSAPGAQVFTLSSADRPYRIFVENMQEGAVTLSSAGVVLYANQRLGDLLGCQVSDVIAKQMVDFVSPPSAAVFLAAMSPTIVATTLDLELRRPNGDVVAAHVGICRLDVDGEILTCLTFTDLTAEHSLLQQVRASQQRFEALYKGAPVPAFTWQSSRSGLILIDYNEAADTQTGGHAADALGLSANAYYRHNPGLLADLNRCLREQIVIEAQTVSQAEAPGSQLHLRVTMVPVPPDLSKMPRRASASWTATVASRSPTRAQQRCLGMTSRS